MPHQHREFLQYLETVACIRQFIIDGLKSRDITSETRSKKETTRTCTEAHRSHLGSWDNGACTKGQFSRGPVQNLSHAEIRLNKDRDVSFTTQQISLNLCLNSTLLKFRSGLSYGTLTIPASTTSRCAEIRYLRIAPSATEQQTSSLSFLFPNHLTGLSLVPHVNRGRVHHSPTKERS